MIVKISGSNYISINEAEGSIRSRGYLLKDQSKAHLQDLLLLSKKDMKENRQHYSVYEKYKLIADYIDEFEVFGEDLAEIQCNVRELEDMLREKGYSVKYRYCRMIVERIFE